MPQITIYTDGSALGNPGPGGYGAVLLAGPLYGAALAWVGRRIAAALLIDRLPELLVAVTPDRS